MEPDEEPCSGCTIRNAGKEKAGSVMVSQLPDGEVVIRVSAPAGGKVYVYDEGSGHRWAVILPGFTEPPEYYLNGRHGGLRWEPVPRHELDDDAAARK